MGMRMKRTVVGSFPPEENMLLERAIRNVVDLQLEYGIDVVTDGEQRGNMIEYFEQIPGLEKTNGKLRIAGKIRPMTQLEDFYKISDYKKVKSYLDSLGRTDVGIKVTLTGPITLGFSSVMNGLNYYDGIRDERIYSDMSQALLPLAQKALDIGAYLQIDEPGLSARFVSPRFAKKFVNELLSGIHDSLINEDRVSLHVCGSINNSKLYGELLDLNVGVLSFGFSGKEEKRNIEIIKRKDFEDHHKRLGAGFISNLIVEDEKIALERLTRISKIVGVENIVYLHPDCGFGSTPKQNVKPILENMEKTSDTFIRSL
ncbi:MAG: 5-methyltetrahydropteroyltriglutamate--homocysteine methyltransferase [Thermoproteota archaeon]|nr:5-methyltetrahydropteroyltriglutamate--homocysteine methyltransferase [Thermoproteota archaeon]